MVSQFLVALVGEKLSLGDGTKNLLFDVSQHRIDVHELQRAAEGGEGIQTVVS